MSEYPNWFMPYAQPLFEKYLLPLAGRPGLRFLQIGAYTGDASLWMLDNVLTGEGSTLTDVDTWRGSGEPEHDRFDWADVERVYDKRVAGRTRKFRCASDGFFRSMASRPFDFIYIDGDHDADQVLLDGVAAIRAMKTGGLLAFDDYQWSPHGGGPGPGETIDALHATYCLEALDLGAQAWFQV